MGARRGSPLKVEAVHPEQCSHARRLQLLGKSPFFAGLAADELVQVDGYFHETGYAAGAPIYFAGDPTTHLYVVAAGKVKLIRHTLSGQDVVLDILTAGEYFGSLAILGDASYPDTAEAQTQVCVLGIGVEQFQAILLRYPAVSVAALQAVAQRLRSAQETIRQLSAFPVEQRVAAILLKLGAKLGEAHGQELLLQVPLTRQDLAGMAGATVETTSRIVSRLEAAGVVRTGRQWIAIVDPEQLATLAQEG